MLYTFRPPSNAILSTCIQDDIFFSLFIFRALLAHLYAAPLHLLWWPPLNVTFPAVGNRILRRPRRRRSGTLNMSLPYWYGAFVISFCIADTCRKHSIRWQSRAISRHFPAKTLRGCCKTRHGGTAQSVYDSVFICNSPTANRQLWSGSEL